MGFFSSIRKLFRDEAAPVETPPIETSPVETPPVDPLQDGVEAESAAPPIQAPHDAAAMQAPAQDALPASSPLPEPLAAHESRGEVAEAEAPGPDKHAEPSGPSELPAHKEAVHAAAAAPAPAEALQETASLPAAEAREQPHSAFNAEETAMALALREAEPRLSAWLSVVLQGVEHADGLLWDRVRFLLRALEAPEEEIEIFIAAFARWLEDMEYGDLEEFRSELQYRLALALDLEDEEDERSRLMIKLSEGLAKTREQIARNLNTLFSAGRAVDDSLWEELEEILIMADVGYETAHALTEALRRRASAEGITDASALREAMRRELLEVFKPVRRISVVNPPEVVLVIGVNGVGKTTTIAKLCHRAVLQGKKVLLVAGDTFRAAATEQLEIWAGRAGAGFYAKGHGADPAAVAYEAIDKAIAEQYGTVFVDTAGRLHTKVNLMEELTKVSRVLGRRHPGAPHRTILVLDATTGQNALNQVKMFNQACSIDELILTKLDGTAKGGIAVAVAMQYGLPISFVGLGEKMDDLRPFDAESYVSALLGL